MDVVECLTAGFAVDRLTLADIRIVRVENEAGDPDKRPFAYIVTGDRNKVCQLRAVRFFPELLVGSGSLRIDLALQGLERCDGDGHRIARCAKVVLRAALRLLFGG